MKERPLQCEEGVSSCQRNAFLKWRRGSLNLLTFVHPPFEDVGNGFKDYLLPPLFQST
ncbi:hypothetical protein HMPREF0973_02148 [Prevotella veroralis F0319]|uniref:Uncharacterized protein n=1 Tax=Prevotella veroralis F0319 TaxID=649761 RepID=C9MQY1_9BACT|nr:hypothetical protein HMPREF0973_02148 [Prevotella veroralis F0319]